MLRPLVRRVFSVRFVSKTGDSTVNFEWKSPRSVGQILPRMMCTAEKASNDATKGEQTESTEGELSELDQKIKLIEEKDGIINDLEVVYFKSWLLGTVDSRPPPLY